MAKGSGNQKSGNGKRGNGEGSIYKRKEGLWTCQVSLPNGKRKYVYGKTRKEVGDKMAVVLRDAKLGLPVPTGRESIAQFLDRWLEDVVRVKNRFRTYESYRSIVRTHLLPALGNRRLAGLTAQDVQRFLNEKSKSASPSMVKKTRDVLRIALGQAMRWRLVSYNAAALTEAPRVKKFEVKPITLSEANAVMAAFKDSRLEALVPVALTLGLRRGEVLGLRWSDVDLDDGTMNVRFQVQRQDGELHFLEPKSKESQRTLPMPPFLVDILRTHRTRQLEERIAAGPVWRDHDLVFPTEVGTPQDGMNVTHRFQARLKRAGLPRMRFHDLRHGAATVLLNNGFTLKEVQEILGHSTFRMTADIYGHISQDARRDWAERMQRAFGA
jgi:integrase